MKILLTSLIVLTINNFNSIPFVKNQVTYKITKQQNSSFQNSDINNQLNFNSSYINEYNGSNYSVLLNGNISLNNLNLSNKFYFANCYGALGYYFPIKWIYNFSITYPNTSIQYSLNFSKLNYLELKNKNTINLNEYFSYSSVINNFLSDFFENSNANIPTLFIQDCTNYADVANFLSLNSNFQWSNPDLTFSSYKKVNLFHLNQTINGNDIFNNLNLQVNTNNLFCTLNLNNINSSYTYNVSLEQLDRYFICFTPIQNANIPSYSDQVTLPVNFSLTNVAKQYYYFNPNLLFCINQVNEYNNNLPYTTFPNLSFSLNTSLLNSLFEANISSQVLNILISHFNDNTLTNDLNYLWNKNIFSWTLVNNILNLFNNEFSYNANINSLTLNIPNDFNLNNLLNLINLYTTNPQKCIWLNELDSIANSNIIPNAINFQLLYQNLLQTYKNCNLQIYFKTNNNPNYKWQNSISINNLSIPLTNNLIYQINNPYEYEFDIDAVTCNLNKYNENIILNDFYDNENYYFFKIIKYNNLINCYINTSSYISYKNNNYLLLNKLDLTSYSLIEDELSNLLKINSSSLKNYISIFNSNYQNEEWYETSLNNKIYWTLIETDIFIDFYQNLINSQTNFINFLQTYNFSDNIFSSLNSSLINNLSFLKLNEIQNGYFQINFNLNNEINFLNLIQNNLLSLANNINYNELFSNVEMNICFNPSLLENVSSNKNNSDNKKTTKISISNNPTKTDNSKNENVIQHKNSSFSSILLIIILVVLTFGLIVLFIIWIFIKNKIRNKIKNKSKNTRKRKIEVR